MCNEAGCMAIFRKNVQKHEDRMINERGVFESSTRQHHFLVALTGLNALLEEK